MRKIDARKIDMSNWMVSSKGNIGLMGHPSTSFQIYQYDAEGHCYMHVGSGFAPGYGQSDRMCVKHWLERQQAG
jgi:hypothetical protein